MTSLEMIQYKRTADMESLYLMLNNEEAIYTMARHGRASGKTFAYRQGCQL